METGVRKTVDGYQAWFKIDNQTFHLDEHIEDTDKDSLQVAEFFEEMLKVAFLKLNIQPVKYSFPCYNRGTLNEKEFGKCKKHCGNDNYCNDG